MSILQENRSFILKRRLLMLAFFLRMFFIGVQYSVILPTCLLYLKRFHTSNLYSGVVIAAYPFSGMLSAALFGHIYDKTMRCKEIIITLNFFQIIGNILYALPYSKWLPLAGRFVAGIGDSFVTCTIGEICFIYPKTHRTGMVSLLELGRVLGFILGPILNFLIGKRAYSFWVLNFDYTTFPGIAMASFWIIMQFVTLFWVKNLAKSMSGKTNYSVTDDDEEEEEIIIGRDEELTIGTREEQRDEFLFENDDNVNDNTDSSLERQVTDKSGHVVMESGSSDDDTAIYQKKKISSGKRFTRRMSKKKLTEKKKTSIKNCDQIETSLSTKKSKLKKITLKKRTSLVSSSIIEKIEKSDSDEKASLLSASSGEINITNKKLQQSADANQGWKKTERQKPSIFNAMKSICSINVLLIFYIDTILWFVQTLFEILLPFLTEFEYGWSPAMTGTVYMVGGGELLVGFFILYHVTSRCNVRDTHLLLASLIFTCMALILITIEGVPKQKDDRTVVFVFVCLLVFAAIPLNLTAAKSLLSKLTRPNVQGFTQGMYASVCSFSLIFGPIVGSLMFHHRMAFGIIGSIVTFVSIFILLLSIKRIHQREDDITSELESQNFLNELVDKS